ncbi:MAG: hypothetical protein IJ486_05455 [Firmicutes bacterium]|nr:hypothetical protein [Bacillota bacterium]
MRLSDREKLYFIEEMNQLLADPELLRIRCRAVNWVDDRLEQNLLDRLKKQGEITDESWNLFLQGDETVFFDVQKRLFGAYHFSRDEKRELSVLSENYKAAAAERMRTYLLKKERTAFQKQAGISAMSWSRFLKVSAYTSDRVTEQIADRLGLSDEERTELRNLVFRDTFPVSEEFKEHVRDLIKENHTSIYEFLMDAGLSENAWEPFRTNPKQLPTSQGTLLKLIIGLHMDRMGGEKLLHRVNSDFVMRRDLAALICLNNRIFEPDVCFYILELFAGGVTEERYYRNLYTDPVLK